jgi:hypothetical protein
MFGFGRKPKILNHRLQPRLDLWNVELDIAESVGWMNMYHCFHRLFPSATGESRETELRDS